MHMQPPTHVLLIDCPDQRGLIHTITGILYAAGLNISRNDEFVDPETRRFFMRTVCEGPLDVPALRTALLAALPADTRLHLAPRRDKNIVVLATREHHCLGDLLLRHRHGELSAQIQAVISNHRELQPLTGAFGVPFHYVSHSDKDRDQHEAEVLRLLEIYQPDYLVLAKYMRILQPAFVARYPRRIINIHHSFLPAFIGANPYRQAFERGVKIIGATAHYVNQDLDDGPIIAQEVLPVDHRYTTRDMAQAGREIEKLTLAKALALVFEDRVFVYGNKTVIL
ncbi:MAG: formyltetrahydrofolate deformylase [Bacteroidia bacterium]